MPRYKVQWVAKHTSEIAVDSEEDFPEAMDALSRYADWEITDVEEIYE